MDRDIITEKRKISLALHTGLMDGISAITADQGEVWLFDVQKDSLIGVESLKDSGNGYYNMQKPNLGVALPVVLPAALYLTIIEAGGKPDDIILEDSKTTLADAFIHGIDSAIAQSIERYLPNGYYELRLYLRHMGLMAVEKKDQQVRLGKTEAYNHQELQVMQFFFNNMLKWMNAVARGEGYNATLENDSIVNIICPESVNRLQDMLRLNVTDGLANGAKSDVVSISGITHVSLFDKKWKRKISFYGYFPSENPVYGIYVELIRKEKLEDPVMDEWPELGKGAAIVCKTVAEMFVKQGQKNLQTINIETFEKKNCGIVSSPFEPVVKEVKVKSVDGIGITF